MGNDRAGWSGPYQGGIGQSWRWYARSGDWIFINADRAGLNADRANWAKRQVIAESPARQTAAITTAAARRLSIRRWQALGLSMGQIAAA
jgi:hypothetical protein